MTRALLRPAVLLALLAAAPALAESRDGTPIDERRAASPGGHVEISNVSGSVTVQPWGRSEVEVTGTLGRGTERLHFEVDGSRTEIEVVLPEGSNRRVEGTDLVVRVPERSRLEVAVVSADVTIERADAGIEIACVSGNVKVSGAPDEVEVAIVSGDVEARLEGDLEEAQLETVSGDVTLHARPAADGRIDVQSVSGDVEVHLPRGTSARFELQTFSGRLTNELSDDRPEEPRFGPGRSLSFSTGGSARVSVQTFSGHLRLKAE
jgi:DUF4097 and DUF4098 domain-containing protein YvlB